MGQSLCDGSESLPIVTSTDTGWGNYSFKRGVRTWIPNDHPGSPEERPKEQFAFVPLQAAANGGLGETMANGLADHLKATLISGKPLAGNKSASPHFLAAYAGQGGRTIEELSIADESTDPRTTVVKFGKGGYYKTSLDDARRATHESKTRGESFSIAALIWMQGEANGGAQGGIVPSRWKDEIPNPAGQEWYRDRLIAYRKQWSDDLRAITGQSGEIPMFTYQTLGPAGEAQLMAADADPHLYMVGPHYAVPSALNSRTPGNRYGAAIHLSADGERWYGEQVAKVIRRVLAEGQGWQPLRPRKAWIGTDRSDVLVEFSVPKPPLVIDEDFLPRQQSEIGRGVFSALNGFRVVDAKGAVLGLMKIDVVAPSRIRIRLASPLPPGAGGSISYGRPHAEPLGTVTGLRPGSPVNGQPTTEILLSGKPPAHLQALMNEGAFYAANTLGGTAAAQAVIRQVSIENGSTTLRYENRERRNDVDFAVGQSLIALRPFSYGNLRDSDPETSTYTFSDSAYGRRAGQHYPLWNWSVLFSTLPFTEE